MSEDFYAQLAADYDRVIRWERRLQAERPAFASLWQRFATKTLLDASCGTGRHLPLFRSMGLEVRASDASQAMVDLARQTLAEAQIPPEEIPLAVSSWSGLPRAFAATFDAVLCIGNSLPYVTDPAELQSSLEGLWSRVAPGGFLLVQFKNFEKLRSQGQRFLPLSWSPPPHETIALRMYDYYPERIDFNVLLLDRRGEEWVMRRQVAALAPYRPEDIEPRLRGLGAQTSLHGSLGLDHFERERSEDAVILAINRS